MTLRVGDWVEVRSKEEILRTLDSEGQLEGLPFMPEMFQFCGRSFRVYKSAHKTCDTATLTGGRWLPNGIHLDLRCDGSAHGGCQAACLLFWKEAWLKPQSDAAGMGANRVGRPLPSSSSRSTCSERHVWTATRSDDQTPDGRYFCQATELPRYTSRLRWWNPLQYLQDYRSGNVTIGRLICGFFYASYSYSTHPRLARIAPALHWVYDRLQSAWGGVPFPRRYGTGNAVPGTKAEPLGLAPGDLVRVKSYGDILATLDKNNKHAGLFFDAEMVPFCGSVYRVRDRIHRFIDEKSGKMSYLRTPAVILEHVWCKSRYSSCRMFCPRSIYSWWREAWLEKVEGQAEIGLDLAVPAETAPLRKVAGTTGA
jgi:hypothetical protein